MYSKKISRLKPIAVEYSRNISLSDLDDRREERLRLLPDWRLEGARCGFHETEEEDEGRVQHPEADIRQGQGDQECEGAVCGDRYTVQPLF